MQRVGKRAPRPFEQHMRRLQGKFKFTELIQGQCVEQLRVEMERQAGHRSRSDIAEGVSSFHRTLELERGLEII